MKFACAIMVLTGSLTLARTAMADTLVLENGDHLTGTVGSSDGKELTLKTDYAGEIKVHWSAVKDVTSARPLYVVTAEKKTVSGNITLEGTDLVIHTAAAGDVHVPLKEIANVRSADDQQAYEKSLHPSLIMQWKGAVNVGFALARGNSDTTNLSTGLTADRKTLSDEIKVYATSVYATNGATSNGGPSGVTANAILGGARYDRNISALLFVFASGDFTHDTLQDLDIRSIYTGGLGWHAIDRPSTTLDVLGGVNYTRENYTSGSAAAITSRVTRNLPGLTAGEDFTHNFGTSVTFAEHSDFYPDLSDISQYRFALDAGLVTKIKKWLGWQTTVSDRYVTNPPIPGTKANDVILSTGFNLAFNQ
jgi:putative salt-induced outer membrane protein YdiY